MIKYVSYCSHTLKQIIFLFFRVSDITVNSQEKFVVTSSQDVIHSRLCFHNALHLTSEQFGWTEVTIKMDNWPKITFV